MSTVQRALVEAAARLEASGVENGKQDARWLMAHAMDIPRDRITLYLNDDLEPDIRARFEAFLIARETRQPVAQIIGQRAFFGRDFVVTPDVLDPRPETETLVEEALKLDFKRVLDLGTGSGAILLSLLAERPGATGLGTDVSQAALDVAARNSARLDLKSRAQFTVSDWFENVQGAFDLIVSNPPYIAEPDIETLEPEVRDWEPREALTAGSETLKAYRIIAEKAGFFLGADGVLLVEHGVGQQEDVSRLFSQNGWRDLSSISDLSGRARVLRAKPVQDSA